MLPLRYYPRRSQYFIISSTSIKLTEDDQSSVDGDLGPLPILHVSEMYAPITDLSDESAFLSNSPSESELSDERLKESTLPPQALRHPLRLSSFTFYASSHLMIPLCRAPREPNSCVERSAKPDFLLCHDSRYRFQYPTRRSYSNVPFCNLEMPVWDRYLASCLSKPQVPNPCVYKTRA